MTSREECAAFATPCADRPSAEAPPEAGSTPGRIAAPAPQPVLIEAAGHTCVAWWHAPAAAGASPVLPLAVVLASSWGGEDMAGYDAQRGLAVALAEGGLGTLRFEWPDTGDSSAATGTTGIADALAAFDAAAARALVLSGHERLAFVGLRLGALLAAHAAVARLDVDALVALMPVASGRAFVRAQAVLAAEPVSHVPPLVPGALFDPAELPVSLGGFALPVRRLEALAALRWPAAATTSVLEALLVGSPQASGRAAADALARMGMRVREWVHEDPSGALAVGEIVHWLRERGADATVTRGVAAIEGFGVADPGNGAAHATLAAARLEAATAGVIGLSAANAPVWMRLRERGVALRERVVRIADAGEPALVGVLGERDQAGAEDDDDATPRHAIVLLSSGRERRVGPHRLWVSWARQRAALRDIVLRLDAAGVGDSAPHAPPDPQGRPGHDDSRIVGELARAVAWLRREQGVVACTVVGIGFGATQAWRAALEGVDVQRIIVIDPPVLRRQPQRASTASAARALRACAHGAVRLLRRPPRDELAIELARSAARGVALDVILSCPASLAPRRGPMAGPALRLPRDSRVTICHVAQAHPGFAGNADRTALYARLHSLVAPSQPGAALPGKETTPDRRVDGRPAFATEATLRAIDRLGRAPT